MYLSRQTVDCYTSCWEGSYRSLLKPGVLGTCFATHCYPFAHRLLLINNVDDPREVLGLADQAIARGECDKYRIVAHDLPMALERCGLRLADIEPVLHFVDFLLVAVATARADYVLFNADDVRLVHPFDWVTDAVARLSEDEQVLVANPTYASFPGLVEKESLRYEDPYWVGVGFSDQCFLASARRLAAPIYGEWNFVSNRFPMSHVGRIFEARVDAYMRNHRLLRLTESRAAYLHGSAAPDGTSHYRGSRWPRLKHAPIRVAASLAWRFSGRRVII